MPSTVCGKRGGMVPRRAVSSRLRHAIRDEPDAPPTPVERALQPLVRLWLGHRSTASEGWRGVIQGAVAPPLDGVGRASGALDGATDCLLGRLCSTVSIGAAPSVPGWRAISLRSR